MAKSKKNSSNTPRRKRYNRKARLQNAKKWTEQYDGKSIAKGYSNWFGVDLVCAITELEILGYKFKQSYKKQVQQTLIARQKQKENRKRKEVVENYEDDTFYFIAGYTSNGVPYGITKEELESEEEITKHPKYQNNFPILIDDGDLPF
ncbi:hypothetical protein [Neobacillus niacini]|jgi:hypothetical protein|uniref:hypothetical protein n=1 Tax=Neobacillus niacini TaxID=86668 RepID=UPI001C8CFC77|nr:hypothetical protein [Neobacillus niacini]MBY0148237.1 hypothetical protein [Neobacillus niacini]